MTTLKKKRSQLPVEVSLVIQTGDDFVSPTYKHKNPDGTPIDLTGTTITAQCRAEKKETATELLTFTVVRDDAIGSYYLAADRTATAALIDGTTDELIADSGYYDIELTDTLGKRTTYWGGPVYIKRTVTA